MSLLQQQQHYYYYYYNNNINNNISTVITSSTLLWFHFFSSLSAPLSFPACAIAPSASRSLSPSRRFGVCGDNLWLHVMGLRWPHTSDAGDIHVWGKSTHRPVTCIPWPCLHLTWGWILLSSISRSLSLYLSHDDSIGFSRRCFLPCFIPSLSLFISLLL